jgi:hypothetical protein
MTSANMMIIDVEIEIDVLVRRANQASCKYACTDPTDIACFVADIRAIESSASNRKIPHLGSVDPMKSLNL